MLSGLSFERCQNIDAAYLIQLRTLLAAISFFWYNKFDIHMVNVIKLLFTICIAKASGILGNKLEWG